MISCSPSCITVVRYYTSELLLALLHGCTHVSRSCPVAVYKNDRTCGGSNVQTLTGSALEMKYYEGYTLAQCMRVCQATPGCSLFAWGAGGCRISSKICTEEYRLGAKIYQLGKGQIYGTVLCMVMQIHHSEYIGWCLGCLR